MRQKPKWNITKKDHRLFIELEMRAENQPDKLAYQFRQRRNGRLQLYLCRADKRARSVAAQLQKIMKKGDRVILVFDNDLEYIAVFYACLYAGIISAPLHPPGRNKSMYRSVCYKRRLCRSNTYHIKTEGRIKRSVFR
ncbi:MAG: AMP-binding protein [Ignavibacteria bacterium]